MHLTKSGEKSSQVFKYQIKSGIKMQCTLGAFLGEKWEEDQTRFTRDPQN